MCGAGLLVLLRALALDAVTVDLTAPGAGRRAQLLDELLEAFEVALDAQVIRAEHVADTFGHVLRLPVHLELDPGLMVPERGEADRALVARARGASPRDHAVGNLLDDLGIPFFDLAGDLRTPMQPLVVKLLHRFDAFHKSRELLELRPLVVCDANGNVHFDRFLHSRHGYDSFLASSISSCCACSLSAAICAPRSSSCTVEKALFVFLKSSPSSSSIWCSRFSLKTLKVGIHFSSPASIVEISSSNVSTTPCST